MCCQWLSRGQSKKQNWTGLDDLQVLSFNSCKKLAVWQLWQSDEIRYLFDCGYSTSKKSQYFVFDASYMKNHIGFSFVFSELRNNISFYEAYWCILYNFSESFMRIQLRRVEFNKWLVRWSKWELVFACIEKLMKY